MATPMKPSPFDTAWDKYWPTYPPASEPCFKAGYDAAEMDCCDALLRADRLITWMAKHIGLTAAPTSSYHTIYAEFNEHGLYMEKLKTKKPRK